MLNNFQLVAMVIKSNQVELYRIPLIQSLQQTLAEQWHQQLTDFTESVELVAFDAAYKPDPEERFYINDFVLPEPLVEHSVETVAELPAVGSSEEHLSAIRAFLGFAQLESGKEVIILQRFSPRHLIAPGRSLLLKKGIYHANAKPSMILDQQCSAVFFSDSKRLVFANFRAVNAYLPLAEYYEAAAEQDIREILEHPSLAAENVDALAKSASQWFRKRFAILRDSKILDEYKVAYIARHARSYDIELAVKGGKIVFPENKTQAKKLLQFLNEELYKGAITDKLYETNSKREADA